MNILILGSGGREHALAEAYAKSKRVKRVFVAPGNGLVDYQNEKIVTVPKVKVLDFDGIVRLVKKEKIGLVDVAQDDPLAAGFVDKLERFGVKAFGPTQKAAQIEWSKEWARNFMVKHKLPIPRFRSFNHEQEAVKYVQSLPEQVLYVKASGLALGKGAIRAENKEEAITAIHTMQQFGKSGETFLIEEGLVGEEFSLFAICDGDHYIITKSSQDHKTIYDHDKGPNTGGIGCVAPTNVINATLLKEIETNIIKPTLFGLQREDRVYKGILYLGGIVTNPPAGGGVKIVEFNARWGDPEAEVILPGFITDYFSIVELITMKQPASLASLRSGLAGGLNKLTIKVDNKVRISVAGCLLGYPGDYSTAKGKEIFGILDVMRLPRITIYGAGIRREGKRFFAAGGRVFHLVAEGKDIIEARRRAYEAMAMISIEGNNLHYRTDIGWRDVERLRR